MHAESPMLCLRRASAASDIKILKTSSSFAQIALWPAADYTKGTGTQRYQEILSTGKGLRAGSETGYEGATFGSRFFFRWQRSKIGPSRGKGDRGRRCQGGPSIRKLEQGDVGSRMIAGEVKEPEETRLKASDSRIDTWRGVCINNEIEEGHKWRFSVARKATACILLSFAATRTPTQSNGTILKFFLYLSRKTDPIS